jgi:hypothetical protein
MPALTDAIWTDEDQARLVALVRRAVATGADHVTVGDEEE